ncbi:MAG: hypothetical protein ACRER2_07065 [Methylococcales bacterium]
MKQNPETKRATVLAEQMPQRVAALPPNAVGSGDGGISNLEIDCALPKL